MPTDPTPAKRLALADVFDLIRGERAYQDAKWGPIDSHGHEVGSWVLIVSNLVNDAMRSWVTQPGDKAALAEIVKVAAVAVACLEEHGGPMVLEWIESLDRIRANAGWRMAGERLQAWTPFLDAIRRRNEALDLAAMQAEKDAAKRLEEFEKRHPNEGA